MKNPKLAPLTTIDTGITYSFFICNALQHPIKNPKPLPTNPPIIAPITINKLFKPYWADAYN
jgi:hypothetical protein